MPRVLLFGAFADVAGWRERDVEGATTDALVAVLSQHEGLADRLARPGRMTVVNRVVVRGDVAVDADAEVAFAPPVSGG